MISKILYSLPGQLLVLLCTAITAQGAISLNAPKAVSRGDAFVATATSDSPVTKFLFQWRGKQHAVPAVAEDGKWQGKILLPAPLTEQTARRRLSVTGAGTQTAHVIIAIHDKKRPVQKLQVDRKFVQPPAAMRERIQKDREKLNKALSHSEPRPMWEMPLMRPVPGTVSSQFGLKRMFNGQLRGEHRGLDLRGAQGTPIHAAADGVVALADNLYYSGNCVYVDHGGGVFSGYLHMSEIKAKPGQRVSRGDVLGLVGATGRVTGPHLHLSVLAQGAPVDPLPLLESAPQASQESANGQN